MFYTQEFYSIIQKIKQSVDIRHNIVTYPNIYFSRILLSLGQRERGEHSIEEAFEQKGYKILSPETFTVDEQIWMLMNCKKFASTECSCSHSAIFCNKDTEVAILKKSDYINKYTSLIADLVGNRTSIVTAHHTVKIHRRGHMWGPFFICVTPQLRAYLRLQRSKTPYWISKEYWAYIAYVFKLIIKKTIFHLTIK